MNKLGFGIILLVLGWFPVGAQIGENDSLIRIFENEEAPLTQRLQSLSWVNWSGYLDTKQGIELLEDGLELAQNAGLDTFAARFIANKGWLYDDLGEFDVAVDLYRKAIRMGLHSSTSFQTLDWYFNLADVFRRKGEYDSSLVWINRIESGEGTGSEKRRGHYIHLGRGLIHSAKQQYREALNHYFPALDGIDDGIVMGLIANCYKELGQTDSSIIWRRKALATWKELNKIRPLAIGYYNIAVTFQDADMMDSAAIYGYKGYEVFKEIEHYVLLNLSALLMSDLYFQQGLYDKADGILNETVELLLAKNQNLHAADVYLALAQNNHIRGLTKQAIENLEKALALIEPNTERFSRFHSVYGDFLKEMDPEEALKHYAIARENQSENQDRIRLIDLSLSVAEVYAGMKESGKVKVELNSLSLSDLSNAQKVRYYDAMVDYYKLESKWDSAFVMVDLARAYTDRVYISEEKSALQETLAKYSVELAEQKQKLVESEARNERRQKYFGFILFGLAIISIVWIRRNHIRFTRERAKASAAKLEASEQRIRHARDILENQGRLILEKNRLITELHKDVELLAGDSENSQKNLESFVESRILTKEDWERFKKYFEAIYPGFFARMEERYPKVTEGELRMLCLVKLEMSNAEIGDMLGVLPHSVKRTKNRFKAKYNIEPGEELSKELDLD